MKEWICSCGQINNGNFCQTCGKPKRSLAIMKIAARTDSEKDSNSNKNAEKEPPVTRKKARQFDTDKKSSEKKVSIIPPSAPSEKFTRRIPPQLYVDDEGLFSSFMKDPQEFLIKRKDILVKALVFFLIFIVTSYDFRNIGSSNVPYSPIITQGTKPKPNASSQNIPEVRPYKLPSKSDMHNVSSDLSLGAICLGDNLDKVHSLLGKEGAIRDNQDGFLRYDYPDVEVVVKNNVVEALVSKTSNVDTKRALHQDSTKQEVISTYGRDYELSEINGNTLLEYPFVSEHEKKSLLRFALKNNVVEYISVRTLSDEKVTSAQKEDVAVQTFRLYWDQLNIREFSKAYDMMTGVQQNRMGEFESYRSGYADMIENKLTDLKVIEKSDNIVRVSYTLQAKDRINGKIKVQIFQGNGILIKSGDNWKIDSLEAKLTRTFDE